MRLLLAVSLALILSSLLVAHGQDLNNSPRSNAIVPMADFGADSPPIALDGYCPVISNVNRTWLKGKSDYRAEFEGCTYLFPADHLREVFVDDPTRFAPVAGGTDVVALANGELRVEGNRRDGVWFRDRVFLFVDETNLATFWSNPEKYAARFLPPRDFVTRR
jgi:YHS domain-containing protein